MDFLKTIVSGFLMGVGLVLAYVLCHKLGLV
jgi:hypothetical protein